MIAAGIIWVSFDAAPMFAPLDLIAFFLAYLRLTAVVIGVSLLITRVILATVQAYPSAQLADPICTYLFGYLFNSIVAFLNKTWQSHLNHSTWQSFHTVCYYSIIVILTTWNIAKHSIGVLLEGNNITLTPITLISYKLSETINLICRANQIYIPNNPSYP